MIRQNIGLTNQCLQRKYGRVGRLILIQAALFPQLSRLFFLPCSDISFGKHNLFLLRQAHDRSLSSCRALRDRIRRGRANKFPS